MNAFESFSEQSRVWIYQADRELSPSEVNKIQDTLTKFAQSWDSHGQPLKAAASVMYQRFIILMVDETAGSISGCSIDKSVHLLQEISTQLKVDLFNRLQLAYWNGEQIYAGSKSALKEAIEKGQIDPSTTVFNNMVSNKAEFENSWQIPLAESWAARFL